MTKLNLSFVALVAVAIFFLFANLDDRYLWLDEAETAFLAKSVLRNGVPKAYDEKNSVRIHIENSYRGDRIWTFHPWLQFYVTAASFALFKASTFTARLPFAIFGLISILLTYMLALQLSRNRSVATLSMALLVCSVPFMLHMRECRYYAPSVCFSLLLFMCYLRLLEGKKGALIGVLVSANLLFHSNYGIFIPVQISLIIHFLIFHRQSRYFKPFLFVTMLIFISTFSWFLYLRGFQHSGLLGWDDIRHHMQYYFKVTHKFIFPVFFFLFVFIAHWIQGKRAVLLSQWKMLSQNHRGLFYILFVVCFIFLCVGKMHFYRYMIHLVPFILIFEATLFYSWFQKSKVVAPVCFVVILTTNVFFNTLPLLAVKSLPAATQESLAKKSKRLSEKLNRVYFSPVYNFIYELTHHYPDSNRAIVSFLNKHAKPTDSVAIPYSGWPIMFYTDLKVHSMWYEKGVLSDWIVMQRDWFETVYGSVSQSAYYKNILSLYTPTVLDVADVRWTHSADPIVHRFKPSMTAPKLVIYRRK